MIRGLLDLILQEMAITGPSLNNVFSIICNKYSHIL